MGNTELLSLKKSHHAPYSTPPAGSTSRDEGGGRCETASVRKLQILDRFRVAGKAQRNSRQPVRELTNFEDHAHTSLNPKPTKTLKPSPPNLQRKAEAPSLAARRRPGSRSGFGYH